MVLPRLAQECYPAQMDINKEKSINRALMFLAYVSIVISAIGFGAARYLANGEMLDRSGQTPLPLMLLTLLLGMAPIWMSTVIRKICDPPMYSGMRLSTYGVLTSILMLVAGFLVGVGAAQYVPLAEEARLYRSIEQKHNTLVQEHSLTPVATLQAMEWLRHPDQTKEHFEQIREVAHARIDPTVRDQFLLAAAQGINSPEVEFVRENGLIREKDYKKLVELLERGVKPSEQRPN